MSEQVCGYCGGEGEVACSSTNYDRCPECKGRGVTGKAEAVAPEREPCFYCDGSGIDFEAVNQEPPCSECKGTGKQPLGTFNAATAPPPVEVGSTGERGAGDVWQYGSVLICNACRQEVDIDSECGVSNCGYPDSETSHHPTEGGPAPDAWEYVPRDEDGYPIFSKPAPADAEAALIPDSVKGEFYEWAKAQGLDREPDRTRQWGQVAFMAGWVAATFAEGDAND
jgi:hypothetical protein